MEIVKENLGLFVLVGLFLVLLLEQHMGKRAKKDPNLAGSVLEAILNALGNGPKKKE